MFHPKWIWLGNKLSCIFSNDIEWFNFENEFNIVDSRKLSLICSDILQYSLSDQFTSFNVKWRTRLKFWCRPQRLHCLLHIKPASKSICSFHSTNQCSLTTSPPAETLLFYTANPPCTTSPSSVFNHTCSFIFSLGYVATSNLFVRCFRS